MDPHVQYLQHKAKGLRRRLIRSASGCTSTSETGEQRLYQNREDFYHRMFAGTASPSRRSELDEWVVSKPRLFDPDKWTGQVDVLSYLPNVVQEDHKLL